MKPEKGLDDMEDKVYDPREMFAEIGLLILEARTADSSTKGRIEGPHCPPLKGTNDHECDCNKLQCRKVSDLINLQDVLWQNKIPMRIDVLLFPNCEHGYTEEMIIEGATFSCVDNFELLERWDVQMVKKRSPERLDGFVGGREHLLAVRSYLHFSQLSSWLISCGGSLPFRVVYRTYVPGESVGYTFSALPEVHSFPSAELESVVMRTTVAHLPRQEHVVQLTCRSNSLTFIPHLRIKKGVSHEKVHYSDIPMKGFNEPVTSTSICEDLHQKYMPSKSLDNKTLKDPEKEHLQYLKLKLPISKKSKEEKSDVLLKVRMKTCPVSRTPKRKVNQLSPTLKVKFELSNECSLNHDQSHGYVSKNSLGVSTKQQTRTIPINTELDPNTFTTDMIFDNLKGVSPNSSVFKTPEKIFMKSHSCKKPNSLSVATNYSMGSKRLPSPKVLVTVSQKPEPSVYKKRCLDLSDEDFGVQNTADNLVDTKPLDEIMPGDLCDLIRPLSPSDLEAYLSSLSNNASKRPGCSKLKDIPVTKCKFFLGDDVINDSDKLEVKTSENQTVQTGEDVNSCDRDGHVRNISSTTAVKSNVDSSWLVYRNTKCDESLNLKLPFQKTSENSKEKIKNDQSKILLNCDKLHEISGADLCMNPSLSRDETVSCKGGATNCLSQREQTLNGFSIPCSIGGLSNSLTSLEQNLESMEIDNGFECPHSLGNPIVLDCEVENGICQEDGENKQCNQQNTKPETRSATSSEPTSSDLVMPKNKSQMNLCSPGRDLSLFKQLLKKEFHQNVKNEMLTQSSCSCKSLPSPEDIKQFQMVMGQSASAVFNTSMGLPSRSSPAPIKKKSSNSFDYDCTLTSVKAIKNAISCSTLALHLENNAETIGNPKILSTSAPASTNCLLGNFEESVLNGRIEPAGVVEGFSVEIGAGGTFCPKHVTLPVIAYFFQLSDDDAPSPYLGYVNLTPLGRRGYHIPRTGTVQVTLFNPNKTVVKMFVVMYDLSDMPANCQTFLRQRTLYTPVDSNSIGPSFLRYLIHLRFQSSKSGKVYLHTDIRLIFARDKFEFDTRVAHYELRSFTEGPVNPKFSPKR